MTGVQVQDATHTDLGVWQVPMGADAKSAHMHSILTPSAVCWTCAPEETEGLSFPLRAQTMKHARHH